MRVELLAACLLSVVVHAGLFWFMPRSALPRPRQAESPTEVELVAVRAPEPPAVSLPPPPPPEQVEAELLPPEQVEAELLPPAGVESAPPVEASATTLARAEPVPESTTYEAAQISAPDRQHLDRTVDRVSAGAATRFALPPLQLPAWSQTEAVPELPVPSVSEVTRGAAAIIASAQPAAGPSPGLDKQYTPEPIRLGDKQRPNHPGLPTLDPALLARAVPTAPPLAAVPPPGSPLGIQGPVARREPVFRPPMPKVQGQAESEIALKFWVRPDGAVSRVLPERKGDTALEVAAIRYLEEWRFTPLSPYEPQVEQWGTITVRFRFQPR